MVGQLGGRLYPFSREGWTLLRGARVGINGSWRDDYLLGTPGGQSMIGGNRHPVNAYLMPRSENMGSAIAPRVGVKNLVDLENNKIRKTGFTTMSNGANLYTYSYVMPAEHDLTASVKF